VPFTQRCRWQILPGRLRFLTMIRTFVSTPAIYLLLIGTPSGYPNLLYTAPLPVYAHYVDGTDPTTNSYQITACTDSPHSRTLPVDVGRRTYHYAHRAVMNWYTVADIATVTVTHDRRTDTYRATPPFR